MNKYLITICLLLAGCVNNGANKPVLTNKPIFQPLINMNKSIGAISTYNYNRFSSPYIITPIPKTQLQYQQFKVINKKLRKYYE